MSTIDHLIRQADRLSMTADEEIEVARRARRGDRAARERLVVANVRFAVQRSHKWKCPGMDDDDMVQEAMLGLMRAAEKFDPEHCCRFITYALWWVDAFCRSAARRHSAIVRSGNDLSRRDTFCQFLAHITRQDGSLSTDAAIRRTASAMGLSYEKAVDYWQLATQTAHGQVVDERDGYTPRVEASQEREAIRAEMLDAITDELVSGRYTPTAIDVVINRLMSDRKTLDEVGKVTGVCRERVRQVEKKTIEKLRAALAA